VPSPTPANGKAQTRRKILVGAPSWKRSSQGEMDKNKLLAWLDEALTRPTIAAFRFAGCLLLAEVPTDV